MCYICNCFSWTLDLIQRFITFALGCLMACAICCGLSVAMVAGIAYGYNYSMAEFLTFSRSDVTVYMRRGQFLDRPDLLPYRRSGDDADLFASNDTDYQQEIISSDTNPLSNTWLKAEDTRRYAERLTKYSAQNKLQEKHIEPEVKHIEPEDEPENFSYYKLTTPPSRLISIAPNRAMSTTVVQSGSSEIVMREFQPDEHFTASNTKYYDYVNLDKIEKETESNRRRPTETELEERPTISLHTAVQSNYVPMRSWITKARSSSPIDYPTEDTDEDNIVYKPV